MRASALRLYPTFPYMERAVLVSGTLPKGGGADGTSPVFAARGTNIASHFYSLHRNPDVFGENVADFDPDRWSRIDPSAWEYMPFGGGQRLCPGLDLSRLELAIFLHHLVINYR